MPTVTNATNCDNCLKRSENQQPRKHSPLANPDACLYAAQVTLSGTARTQARFGKTLVAQMLTGSSSRKIQKNGLHKLSTFGLLSGLRQMDVVTLIDWLIDHGYLKQSEQTRFRPILEITDSGRELMRGDIDFGLVATDSRIHCRIHIHPIDKQEAGSKFNTRNSRNNSS